MPHRSILRDALAKSRASVPSQGSVSPLPGCEGREVCRGERPILARQVLRLLDQPCEISSFQCFVVWQTYDDHVESIPRLSTQNCHRNDRACNATKRERSVKKALQNVWSACAACPGIPSGVGQAGTQAKADICHQHSSEGRLCCQHECAYESYHGGCDCDASPPESP